jgi:hypothetical protein
LLHYILEARGEPLDWRDVEALPLYIAAIALVLAAIEIVSNLGPAAQSMTLKAMLIVALLGIRHYAMRDEDDDANRAETATA